MQKQQKSAIVRQMKRVSLSPLLLQQVALIVLLEPDILSPLLFGKY